MLLVPVLTELFNYNQRQAAGITLAAMVPPVTLPGAWRYYSQGHVEGSDLLLAGCLAISFSVGVFAGATVQSFLDLSVLRTMFGLLMVYVAVRVLTRSTPETASAAAGVVSVGIAWIGFLWLRALGRKYRPVPSLADEVRRHAEQPSAPDDYVI